MSSSIKSREFPEYSEYLSQGEVDADLFGVLDRGPVGKPVFNKFGRSGLRQRYGDVAEFDYNVNDENYNSAFDSYKELADLFNMMRRTRGISAKDAEEMMQGVIDADEELKKTGKLPEWVQDYVSDAEAKVQAAQQAIIDGDKQAASVFEYRAALEHKKLAYYIMESLTKVAIGQSQYANEWRKERVRTRDENLPLIWNDYQRPQVAGPAVSSQSQELGGGYKRRHSKGKGMKRRVSKRRNVSKRTSRMRK